LKGKPGLRGQQADFGAGDNSSGGVVDGADQGAVDRLRIRIESGERETEK